MQGTLAPPVSMAAPPERREGAFGVFNAAGGMGMLGAGLLAGLLWDAFGRLRFSIGRADECAATRRAKKRPAGSAGRALKT